MNGVDAQRVMCGARSIELAPESGRVSIDQTALTDDATGSCGGGGVADAAYAIDVGAGESLLVAADYETATTDTLVHIRRTCDDEATELVCESDSGFGDAAAYRAITPGAGRYYVFLDADAAGGTFDATLQTLLPAGAACNGDTGRAICGPGLVCMANQCAPASCPIAMTDTLTFIGDSFVTTVDTTTLPNDHAGSCSVANDGGVRANEAIIVIGLTVSAALRVSTDDSATDYDTLVYVRDTCLGTELACDDDGGTGGNRSIATTATLAPGSYLVFIDGFAWRYGSARVTITAQ